MGLNKYTIGALQPYLPGRILSLGFPDRIVEMNLHGSTLTCVDLFAHHGTEIVADLSVPQDLGKFDIVLDTGTIEHVANPAQAFINAASAVKVGGIVFHHLPITMVNHGYWNISPCWFTDFYGANGFVTEKFELTEGVADVWNVPWPNGSPNAHMGLNANSLTLFIARRKNDNPIKLPKCQPMWGS